MNDSQLTLAMALDCAEKGIPVFPCNPKTKSPLNAHGHKEATTDVAQIKEWWSVFSNAMLRTRISHLVRFSFAQKGNSCSAQTASR